MTNYIKYPGHRFERGTCIICFDAGYSWCMLHENQKKYLAESNYLDGASRIDIKLYSGKVFSLSVEQFKDWVSSGKKEPDIECSTATEIGEVKKCPLCGKELRVRIARKGPGAGNQFLGCSGFPDCKYTEQMAN